MDVEREARVVGHVRLAGQVEADARSKGNRAIVATALTNMRIHQKSLKFLRSLTVHVLYTFIVVFCGCKGGSGRPQRRRHRRPGPRDGVGGPPAVVRRSAVRDVPALRHPHVHGVVGNAEPGHHDVQPDAAGSQPVGGRRRVGGHEVRRADDPASRRVRTVELAGQHVRRRLDSVAGRPGGRRARLRRRVPRPQPPARSLLLGLGQHAPGGRHLDHGHHAGQRRAARLRKGAADRALDQLRQDPPADLRRVGLEDGPPPGPVPGDPRAGEIAAAGLPDARQQPPDEPVGERPGGRRGGAGQHVRPRRQHVPGRPDAEDKRFGRERLVLGAQRRQHHDDVGDRHRPPRAHRALVDELPAQLRAQPRRPVAAGDRVAAGRGRRGLGTRHVAAPAARAAAADRRRVRSGRRDRDQWQRRLRRRRQGRLVHLQRLGVVGRAAPVGHGRPGTVTPGRVRAQLRPALRRAGRSRAPTARSPRTTSPSAPTEPRSPWSRPGTGPPAVS